MEISYMRTLNLKNKKGESMGKHRLMKIVLSVVLFLILIISIDSRPDSVSNAAYPIKKCGTEIWRNQLILGSKYNSLLATLPCKWTRFSWGGEASQSLGLYATYVAANNNMQIFDTNGVAEQINLIKAAGKEPVIIFVGQYPATCAPLPPSQYANFGTFVRDFAKKFRIKYVEIWNEPDYAFGLPNLYGCWGVDNSSTFINLLQAVRNKIPVGSTTKIGVSFGLADYTGVPMLQAVADSHLTDFIGIHHYEYYQQTPPSNWPNLIDKINKVRSVYPSGELWLTETNLLKWNSPSQPDTCINPPTDFFEQQGNYINFAMRQISRRGINSVFAYSLTRWDESWKCAALVDPQYNPLPSYWNLK